MLMVAKSQKKNGHTATPSTSQMWNFLGTIPVWYEKNLLVFVEEMHFKDKFTTYVHK